MKNKKAISDVVATVLIILITVAAVAIVWAAVIPMIQKPLAGATGACNAAQTDLSIVTTEGRTCNYTTFNKVQVQVARGAGDYDLQGIWVIPSVAGSSSGTTFEDTTAGLPPKNGEQVYNVSVTGATSVKIASVVRVGAANINCSQSQEVTLQPC